MKTEYTFSHVGHLKYQVMESFEYELPKALSVPGGGEVRIPKWGGFFRSEFITLNGERLVIRGGFAYDGATNVIDTRATKAAALIHDALYFVLRNEDELNSNDVVGGGTPDNPLSVGSKHYDFRKYADVLYYRLARANGMWWPRARLHYRALRRYGRTSAKPRGRRRIRDVKFTG